MKTGAVFISTGGPKIIRAVRSFKQMEPDLPVHVLMDMTTNTWKANEYNPSLQNLRDQFGVLTEPLLENDGLVNGAFNAGVRWMKELGYERAACFHDDLIFPHLHETRYYLTKWFARVQIEPEFRDASGIAFGHFEALVFWPGNIKHQSGNWHRAPTEWDKLDLESDEVWNKLVKNGVPEHEVDFPDMNFFTLYEGLRGHDTFRYLTRLGPTGFIIPIDKWEEIGGFDEQYGIFYDIVYPSECAVRGWNPVIVAPNSPFLHLHNQTQAFGDPMTNTLFKDTLGSFTTKYGMDIDTFWLKNHPEWIYEGKRNWFK